MRPKKQKFNRIPNDKLILASSLIIFGCTPVVAQPFNDLLMGQSPVLNGSGQSNQLPVPTLENNVRSNGDRLQPENLLFAAPPLPPGTGAPSRRTDSGSRNPSCPIDNKNPLTALVPTIAVKDVSDQSVGGFTTAERPTFWFYVPYQPPLTGKFVLRDRNDNLVYEQDVTLPGKPGAIAISLPTTEAPITAGEEYRWSFRIYCQPGATLLSFVEGWIQRTSLDSSVENQLQKAAPQQKVALYASNGIWYEALNAAAELRRTNSSDRNWSILLQDVGLSKIAQEAIAAN